MSHWVSKAEVARKGNTSRALITQKCVEAGVWFRAGAVSPDGNVDIENSSVSNWLESRASVVSPNDLTSKEFGKMTINRVTEHYGGVAKLEIYVKTRKLLADTEHKQVMMAEKRGELVDRDTIAKACFGFLEGATQKLLEMPRGVVERILAILETETPSVKEQCEEFIASEISKILKGVQHEVCDKLHIELERQQKLQFEEDVLEEEEDEEDEDLEDDDDAE